MISASLPAVATRLIFRSSSGRTEVSVGPRGLRLNVLHGEDTLTEEDAVRLRLALGAAGL